MAQEIYHRSNWGNPTETWGNSYLNADLTNELYKRASEYENSWVTDQLLNGVGTKPSIILTPTAYEDGVLNSVKPAKTFGSELVTNGTFDTDSDWTFSNVGGTKGWRIADNRAICDISGASNGRNLQQNLDISITSGKKYKVSLDILQSEDNILLFIGGQTVTLPTGTNLGYETTFVASSTSTLITFFAGTSDTQEIDNISIKEQTEADFDFTRGSSATRVNEKGLVQDVQLLSGELVQNGDFEQIGSEEVTNGGFDTDSGWTLPSGSSISGGSLNFDGTQTGGININQNITSLDLTKIYKVTFTVSNYISGSVKVKISNDAQGTDKTANGTYTEYLSGMVNKTLSIRANADFIGSIDNVSVKEVGQNWTFGNAEFEDGRINIGYGTNSESWAYQVINSMPLNNSSFRITYNISSLNYNTGSAKIVLGYGSDNVNKQITDLGENSIDLSYSTITNHWLQIVTSGDAEVTIDNISMKEITDDTDLPRINYTDGEGSLLLEPQSTNLITYSEDFSEWNLQSGGTGTDPVITSNNTISPDGNQNADKIVFNKGNGVTVSDLSIISSSSFTSQTNTTSFYIKADSPQKIVFRNSSNWQLVDVTTEWQRISKTDTGGGIQIGLRDGYGIANVPNTATVYLWGAQAEALSYATSYIPTDGSTVTRLADVCNNSGNSDLINSTEGVLYAEAKVNSESGFSVSTIGISDGTDSNRLSILLYRNIDSIRSSMNVGGVTQFDFNLSGYNREQYYKIAISYKQNDCKLFINGVKVGTDTSATMPSSNTFNKLNLDIGNGAYDFYGNVKCVAVFKEALSDTELQKLTTI